MLNAKIIVKYKADLQDRELETMEFPYIPSVYYLYDPFLNWMLGLDQEFVPALAEQEHPRPEKLYKESPVMYNYVLAASGSISFVPAAAGLVLASAVVRDIGQF